VVLDPLAVTGVPFKSRKGVNAKDIEGGNVMKVIVVGAGIGGLTAHRVCKKAGFEVEHYERQPHLGPAGAGIVLWSTGQDAVCIGSRRAAPTDRASAPTHRDQDP
jgi:2-polyprenyl-6-methoxyphenol hydroxylase-like FAD-dependent oxidoreductase